MRACDRGFTLMEIVVVILLLGVLGIYTTQFIGSGTRMYADVAAREQLMNDVRFGVERLNREVRDAIPGSLQVTSAPACIRFWPIKAASRYLQLPGSAAGSTMLAFIPGLAEQQVAPGDLALVFPQGLDPETAPYVCSHGNCVLQVASVTSAAPLQSIQLQAQSGLTATQFATPSPGQRVYYADRRVSFCQQGSQLIRQEQLLASASMESQIMAEALQSASFSMDSGAFNSHGEVLVRLLFSRRDEAVQFSHLLEVDNVP